MLSVNIIRIAVWMMMAQVLDELGLELAGTVPALQGQANAPINRDVLDVEVSVIYSGLCDVLTILVDSWTNFL